MSKENSHNTFYLINLRTNQLVIFPDEKSYDLAASKESIFRKLDAGEIKHIQQTKQSISNLNRDYQRMVDDPRWRTIVDGTDAQ